MGPGGEGRRGYGVKGMEEHETDVPFFRAVGESIHLHYMHIYEHTFIPALFSHPHYPKSQISPLTGSVTPAAWVRNDITLPDFNTFTISASYCLLLLYPLGFFTCQLYSFKPKNKNK